jgi:hypothetical protein
MELARGAEPLAANPFRLQEAAMRISRFSRHALISSAAAGMLAACAPSTMPQALALATRADRGKSWMAPEAMGGKLLYITDGGNSGGGYVSVYSYPHGHLVGTLTGLDNPDGSCVDRLGDVFITDVNAGDIVEYTHGGTTPIKTLSDGSSRGPVGCAIDSVTGNLAVANVDGSVGVYRKARGNPTFYYFTHEGDAYFCGYDDSGNLFVDGLSYHYLNEGFQFAELPRRKTTFEVITINETVESPGQVQWDGKYIAVGDAEQRLVYRVDVIGSSGTVKQTVQLTDGGANAFLIRGRRLIDASYFYGAVEYYRYPAGGSPRRVIAKGVTFPNSATVSDQEGS